MQELPPQLDLIGSLDGVGPWQASSGVVNPRFKVWHQPRRIPVHQRNLSSRPKKELKSLRKPISSLPEGKPSSERHSNFLDFCWSRRAESNRRPTDYEYPSPARDILSVIGITELSTLVS
jgi:hypothetical protein